MTNLKSQEGFIALISAIVISFLLITITVALNFVGFYGRFNILDSEYKETSVGLAEACADSAMLQLVQGIMPLPGTIVTVGSNQCTIVSVVAGPPSIIKTQAVYPATGNNKSYTNLKISFTPGTFVVHSWQECANTCP